MLGVKGAAVDKESFCGLVFEHGAVTLVSGGKFTTARDGPRGSATTPEMASRTRVERIRVFEANRHQTLARNPLLVAVEKFVKVTRVELRAKVIPNGAEEDQRKKIKS